MKPKHKVYLKLNLMSLFFLGVSFISITLAWFAYSGMSSVSTEISVQAWYIEFEKDAQIVSNDIVISLDDVYPGMETYSEKVQIKNKGDALAQISYEITSARILDNEMHSSDFEPGYLEDQLSHEYPFHVNISLSKKFALAKDGISEFEVSISWPLDSDNDKEDSKWGTDTYLFKQAEEKKHVDDSNYQMRSPLKLVINVNAEQYLETETSSDPNYSLGEVILFDVVNNQRCMTLGGNCIKTYVIDPNNKLGDPTVDLLPDLYSTYAEGTFNNYNSLLTSITNKWNVSTRSLTIDDVLKPISLDVVNSIIVNEKLSNLIIGDMQYKDRVSTEVSKLISYNSYYQFLNNRFNYLVTHKCYWINSEYDTTRGFALTKIDDLNSKIYGLDKTSSCSVVPVIVASKTNLV